MNVGAMGTAINSASSAIAKIRANQVNTLWIAQLCLLHFSTKYWPLVFVQDISNHQAFTFVKALNIFPATHFLLHLHLLKGEIYFHPGACQDQQGDAWMDEGKL